MMNLFRSIRVRFAIWTTGLLLVVLCVLGVFVYISMRQGLMNSIDDSLRVSALQTSDLVNIENGQISLTDAILESSSTTDLKELGLTIRVISTAGNILQSFGPYRSLPIDQKSLESARLGNPEFNTVTTKAADSIRIYTETILDNQHILGFVQVMQSLSALNQALDQLLLVFLISVPILLIISLLGGYILAARALAPIDQITRTTQHISVNDLSARLNIKGVDDEVGRLAGTLDNMLSRLEEGFNRERQFTADASHELRTPLAAMQAILNVTREKRRSPKEYEKALDDICEETERLRNLIEDLLYIARTDGPQADPHEVINISNLLLDVGESLHPMVESKGLALHIDVQKEIYLMGDSDALIRLFVNLIDNAIKYTDAGIISIKAIRKDNKKIEAIVRDTGRGISEAHLSHIFERFYQVDGSRTEQGAGLGLAIVKGIVQAHHGLIKVSSQVGIGTSFVLSFSVIKKN